MLVSGSTQMLSMSASLLLTVQWPDGYAPRRARRGGRRRRWSTRRDSARKVLVKSASSSYIAVSSATATSRSYFFRPCADTQSRGQQAAQHGLGRIRASSWPVPCPVGRDEASACDTGVCFAKQLQYILLRLLVGKVSRYVRRKAVRSRGGAPASRIFSRCTPRTAPQSTSSGCPGLRAAGQEVYRSAKRQKLGGADNTTVYPH